MSASTSAADRSGRSPAFWLAIVATVLLAVLYVGDVAGSLGFHDFEKTWNVDLLGIAILGVTLQSLLTIAFWIVGIALVVLLFQGRREPGASEVEIEGPAFVRFLFYNSRAGLFWLPIRIFLAIAWINAGVHKLVDPAWQDGTALAGFWGRIVEVPEGGRPPITYEWYRSFIQALIDGGHEGWFSWLIMVGETAVGLGLLFGLLTGLAAFFGALMNMSFLLAGSASTNPVLFTLAVGIMMAWRVAGYYGLDRYVMPKLGTPWTRGPMVESSGGRSAS